MSDTDSFEGIFNFRDYGGYATPHGRVVTNTLYRSGHHHGATPADLDLFGRHEVRTIIDLRGDSERAAYPCTRAEGFAADVVFAPGETDGRDPAVPPSDFEDAADAERRMLAIYRLLPFAPALVATYRLYLAALIARPGPSMVHCFAGKDRTGIAVALTHTLLGVSPDDLMADYLRSADPALLDRRVALDGPIYRERLGPRSDAALRRMFGVEPGWLEAAFAAMTDRHGSVAGYAKAMLGMTPERVEALRRSLIV